MPFASPVLLAVALALWLAIATVLARRAQLRAVGHATMPWIALVCASALAGFAIVARPAPGAATCGAACVALAIAGDADARTGYLFDAITLPSVALILALACYFGTAGSSVLGCAIVVLIFGAIVRFSRGRAMGMGDVKAMASIGAAFGPAESMLAIAAACASGIVEAGIRGRLHRNAEIRFGPHLAIGSAVALIFGGSFVRAIVGG